MLVTTRVLRNASCGTLPEPNERPSNVMLLAVARCPATEKAALVESVSLIATTPGASVARVFRSEASIGRRATASGVRLRSVEPGVGRSAPRCGARARTVTASNDTATTSIRTLATRRSSSACRATVTRAGAIPR